MRPQIRTPKIFNGNHNWDKANMKNSKPTSTLDTTINYKDPTLYLHTYNIQKST